MGYYNEHTKKEILNTTAMNRTLKVLKNLDISLFNKPFKAKPILGKGLRFVSIHDDPMDWDYYTEGYNHAMELGFDKALEILDDESLFYADEEFDTAFKAGFRDALDDMESFKA